MSYVPGGMRHNQFGGSGWGIQIPFDGGKPDVVYRDDPPSPPTPTPTPEQERAAAERRRVEAERRRAEQERRRAKRDERRAEKQRIEQETYDEISKICSKCGVSVDRLRRGKAWKRRVRKLITELRGGYSVHKATVDALKLQRSYARARNESIRLAIWEGVLNDVLKLYDEGGRRK